MTSGRIVAALLAAVGVLAGSAVTAAAPGSPAVVVASFNFAESRLVAEIYAQALESEGLRVRRELDLGPRELVQPALAQGFVDVVPEYLGSALRSIPAADGEVDADDPAAVRDALAAAVRPWGLEVLTPSPAQDQNGFVMLRRRAEELGVRRLGQLGPHAARLVLGGPPECPTRPLCLVGLRRVYGLRFARFVPLPTAQLESEALEQGVIDVAVLFTTDGRLADPDLLLLEDDRGLQPAESIVPVVSSAARRRHGERLPRTLDAVSARLTAAGLRFLNWRVDVAGRDPADEARGWLRRHPLP